MNTITLFKAYKEARDEMEYYAAVRGTKIGIAESKDDNAIKWQRYGRLARRIELRMGGYKVCTLCLGKKYPNGYTNHLSNCKRYTP